MIRSLSPLVPVLVVVLESSILLGAPAWGHPIVLPVLEPELQTSHKITIGTGVHLSETPSVHRKEAIVC
jgi:hypothetical protein